MISKLNTPILNKFSTFDTLEGRLGGIFGEDGGVETCSFFGLVVIVERDQGAMRRPKSGFDHRFSLVEVGCPKRAEAETGRGDMRGSYAINRSLTPKPESIIRCGDIGRA